MKEGRFTAGILEKINGDGGKLHVSEAVAQSTLDPNLAAFSLDRRPDKLSGRRAGGNVRGKAAKPDSIVFYIEGHLCNRYFGPTLVIAIGDLINRPNLYEAAFLQEDRPI